MKTSEELRLEFKISDMIYSTFADMLSPNLEIANGDIQGICQALAMQIIKEVK
jgi:hypothetical protein